MWIPVMSELPSLAQALTQALTQALIEPLDRWQRQDPLLEQRVEPFLSPREALIMRAFVQALFDDGHAQPDAARLDWMELELQDMFGDYTGLMRAAARALPWIVELSPLWVLRRPALFSASALPERVRCLERMERSQDMLMCAPLALLKVLCTTIYLEHPEVARELHAQDRYAYDPEDRAHALYAPLLASMIKPTPAPAATSAPSGASS